MVQSYFDCTFLLPNLLTASTHHINHKSAAYIPRYARVIGCAFNCAPARCVAAAGATRPCPRSPARWRSPTAPCFQLLRCRFPPALRVGRSSALGLAPPRGYSPSGRAVAGCSPLSFLSAAQRYNAARVPLARSMARASPCALLALADAKAPLPTARRLPDVRGLHRVFGYRSVSSLRLLDHRGGA